VQENIERIGVIMNGVTGRMGTNQHLARSILAIREQGGVELGDGVRLMPEPILTGRNEEKLKALAIEYGVEKYSTDLDAVPCG
jgi:predicted dehydrogenase